MIIPVINQKGGVGKTAVSINLSYGLNELGKKVLLVDIDPQAHSTIIFKNEGQEDFKTVGDLLKSKSFNVRDSIYPAHLNGGKLENLDIIPATIKLAATARQLSVKHHREKLLLNHLQKVAGSYDYIFIDCPPTLGDLTVNAIYAADLILIPTIYSKYSLDGIADLFDTINEVKETDGFKHYRILRNAKDGRNTATNSFIEDSLTPFKSQLLKSIIRKCESINQAIINEEVIYTYDSNSNGTKDFRALSKEIADQYYG